MFTLFCRHCWKDTETWYGVNNHHIEARCRICGGWIKFLNSKEVRQLSIALLALTMPARPVIGCVCIKPKNLYGAGGRK